MQIKAKRSGTHPWQPPGFVICTSRKQPRNGQETNKRLTDCLPARTTENPNTGQRKLTRESHHFGEVARPRRELHLPARASARQVLRKRHDALAGCERCEMRGRVGSKAVHR